MADLAPQFRREQRCGLDAAADTLPQPAWRHTPSGHVALVAEVVAVTAITSKELVTAFAGEDHFDLARSQTRYEIQRNAGGPGDRLILVPDRVRQSSKEIV